MLDFVHHADRVRARLALNGQHNGPRAGGRRVIPGGDLVVLHAVENFAQLFEPHGVTVAISDNHRTECRRVLELTGGLYRERLMPAVKYAGRLLHVALFYGLLDLINAEAVSRQFVRVHLHADGVLLRTENGNLRDSVHHGDALRQHVFGIIVHC